MFAGEEGIPFSVTDGGCGSGFSGYTYTSVSALCNDDSDGLCTGGGGGAGAELYTGGGGGGGDADTVNGDTG